MQGYDRRFLDPTVRPQDDFYRFAVGGYLAAHPIPPDRSSWGLLEQLSEDNFERLHRILEAIPPSPPGTPEQKLRDFYRSGMDQAVIDETGLGPLADWLARIDGMDDLQAEIARCHAAGVGVLFDFGSAADAGHPAMNVAHAWQGGLGLPDRDYYLEPAHADVLQRYHAHVGAMLRLSGVDAAGAAAVVAIETRLARTSMDKVDLRHPDQVYNMRDLDGLQAMTPRFEWARYFASLGRPDITRVNVEAPAFFEALDRALVEVPLADWKLYFRWHVLTRAAPHLSRPFEAEDFDFHGRVMTGAEHPLPRWRRIVADTDAALGDALGLLYVRQAFPPQAREAAHRLVESIRDAARDSLVACPWMADSTRASALRKLEAMRLKIGHPDRWKDYAALHVTEGPYIENVLRAWRFETDEDLAKIDRPVDRTEWAMTASTANAYYDDTANEFVIPAGLLQPPLYDVAAEDAANYGATGAAVGHELTHAFDDEGSHYDWEGRLDDWWTEADDDHFQAIADGVARQMGEFSLDGVHEDGELVQGESLADLGGLELAWSAWQRIAAGRPQTPGPDGFTADQRFFLYYAFSWAANLRPELARLHLTTDEHPLPAFRVNGPLANMPAFWQAFDVRPGDPMRRPDPLRNHLWEHS